MTSTPKSLALLIDADNASSAVIAPIIEAASRRGSVLIRRAFGDWTTSNLSGWKSCLHRHAIQPVQQFAYCSGKNATDSALIIDAMDILYTANVDAFCLVSSDSDFTRLATRLRESGKSVHGFGERKACEAFVSACETFTWIEDLRRAANTTASPPRKAEIVPADLQGLLSLAIGDSAPDGGWLSLAALGMALRLLQPGFDARIYGAKTLKELMVRQRYVQCRRMPDAAGSKSEHLEVRLLTGHARKPARNPPSAAIGR